MHDVHKAFYEAEKALRPEDKYAGNPSVWPNSRGLSAVTELIVRACHDHYTEKKR